MLENEQQEIEIVKLKIKDRYVNRKIMHLFKLQMIGKQICKGDQICSLESESIEATIYALKDSKGNELTRGEVTRNSKVIFRSKSAKIFLLIQISQEMWIPISGTGYLPVEILMWKFLPEYFRKIRQESCSHSV